MWFASWARWVGLSAAILAVATPACRTLAPLPAVDLSRPGWVLHRGQALWKPGPAEIAGELLYATNTMGDALLEFSKTPLPLVTVRLTRTAWEVAFIPEDRILRGRGTGSVRLQWLHLARALSGQPPPGPWQFQEADGGWSLTNEVTSESIVGFLER